MAQELVADRDLHLNDTVMVIIFIYLFIIIIIIIIIIINIIIIMAMQTSGYPELKNKSLEWAAKPNQLQHRLNFEVTITQ